MVPKRIKYARMHLSKGQYINKLAQPNWRRLKKWTINIAPHPYTVSRLALKSRASKRIKIMAQPIVITKKYSTKMELPKITPARSQILDKTPSQRIIELSLPKQRVVVQNKKMCSLKSDFRERLKQILQKIKETRYQKYRTICNILSEKMSNEERELRKKLFQYLTPQDWQRHEEILKKLATPKRRKQFRTRTHRKKKKVFKQTNLEHIQMLAQPVIRKTLDVRDPFAVSPSALNYNVTERILRLATARERHIIPPRIPGEVSRAALKAIEAGPNLIKLAAHATRSPGREIDVRENAFTVSPTALRYKCSPAIARLARPKKYGKARMKKRKAKKTKAK